MPNTFIPKIEYGTGPTTIEFETPPEGFDPNQKKLEHIGKVSESANGTTQTSTNYIKNKMKFTWQFISKSLIDTLETFYTVHGIPGKSFKYYPDKDEAAYFDVEIDKSDRKFNAEGTHPDGLGDFKYKLKTTFKRVL